MISMSGVCLRITWEARQTRPSSKNLGGGLFVGAGWPSRRCFEIGDLSNLHFDLFTIDGHKDSQVFGPRSANVVSERRQKHVITLL